MCAYDHLLKKNKQKTIKHNEIKNYAWLACRSGTDGKPRIPEL